VCTTSSLEGQQSALAKMKWSWMFLNEQGIETWNECKKNESSFSHEMEVHANFTLNTFKWILSKLTIYKSKGQWTTIGGRWVHIETSLGVLECKPRKHW
jgi:hypothetical protein